MANQVSRRNFSEAAIASGLWRGAVQAQSRRPNIVFICSDQHTGRPLPGVRTPHLDRLAAAGVRFENAYSCAPVCVPGRAALMSGMFASDVGAYCNSTPFDGRVPSWGNRLRDAGYHCWATGKLDLVRGKDYGFVEAGNGHGHDRNPDITSLFRRPLCFRPGERSAANGRSRPQPHKDKATAERGLEFLRSEAQKAGKPWAMYVGFVLPHPAFQALPQYLDMYPESSIELPRIPSGYLETMPIPLQTLRHFKNVATPIPQDRVRRARAAYYGMISELDSYVGQIMNELERRGELENTIFIYTSDHGEMLGENGLWLKNCLLEGAARVPLTIAGPGLTRGKVVETPVSHVDLVATVLDLGGVSPVASLRGRSLVPLMNGSAGSHPGYAFSESHSEGNCTGSFMIRKGDWKYIYFAWDKPALYNLRKDPHEFENLAGQKEHSAIQRELHGILTSLLNPDEVTEQAFQAQERLLARLVAEKTPAQFHAMIRGRLGDAQAGVLTRKHYGGRSPA
jgi:choline-sulfatase